MTGLVALKLIHVACASVWFGASWLAGADVRRTLALGRPHADALPERISRLERLAIPCGVLTLLTGHTHWNWSSSHPALPRRGLTRERLSTLDAGSHVASSACYCPLAPFGRR